MTSNESTHLSQKRQLVDEINFLLEQTDSQLSSIIRKAIRLAELCGDLEHRLLFDIHLDGVDLTGASGTRIERWPDPTKEPKWDITSAFYQDRQAPNGQSIGISIGEIESKLKQIPETKARMAAKGNHPAANELMQAELIYVAVLERIRNRVGAFVRQVERELIKSEATLRPTAEGKRRVPLKKEQGIIAAILAALVAIVTAYWQYVYKPSHADAPKPVKYAGRVVDSNTQQVIRGAKISVEIQGAPQVYYTDSEGVFYLELPAQVDATRIRVESKGYEVFDRNVSVSRTGIEDVRLTPTAGTPTPTSTPTPMPTNSPVTQHRIHTTKSTPRPTPYTAEQRLLGKC